MKIQFIGLVTLSTICGALCSCNITKQRVDYNWFKDTITAAQDDVVTVEAGSGMPATEAAAPASTPAVAAAPAVTAPATPAPQQPAAPLPAPAPAAAAPATPVATTGSTGSKWWSFGQRQKTAAAAPAAPVATTGSTGSKWWFFGQRQKTEATAPLTYTVKQGDTLSVIARRHGVNMATLVQANALSNPNALRIGQVLTIPGRTTTATAPKQPAPRQSAAPTVPTPAAATAPTTATRYYTISKGDTLSAIARRHNVSIAAIMQLNNMTTEQAQRLSIGQRIILPAK